MLQAQRAPWVQLVVTDGIRGLSRGPTLPGCAALSHPPVSRISLQTPFFLQSNYSTESEPCISASLISQGSTQRACFHEMQRLQTLIRCAWFIRGRGKGIEASLHAHDLHPSVIRVKRLSKQALQRRLATCARPVNRQLRRPEPSMQPADYKDSRVTDPCPLPPTQPHNTSPQNFCQHPPSHTVAWPHGEPAH